MQDPTTDRPRPRSRDRDKTGPLARPFRRAKVSLLRRIPRKRHLRDTWLHRWFGERLFDPHIWHVSRAGVAGGLAVGVFISFTPLIGAHMLLAVVAACVFRLNLPAALVGAWFMNPVTAPVLLPVVYKVGQWLDLTPETQLGTGYAAGFRKLLHQVAELTIGGLLLGTFSALGTYAAVLAAWAPLAHLRRTPRLPSIIRRPDGESPRVVESLVSEGQAPPADSDHRVAAPTHDPSTH